MSYFLEVWFRGFAKDYLRSISNNKNKKHHMTFIRPFDLIKSEEEVKQNIVSFCQNKELIKFTLEGKDSFNKTTNYVPIHSPKLLEFNYDLEKAIEKDVNFVEKLNKEKILHATVDSKEFNCPTIEQYMLRLTAIKDKKIWFSYDFVTKQVLSREESLDKAKWYSTVHEFTNQTDLLPTRQGYKKIY